MVVAPRRAPAWLLVQLGQWIESALFLNSYLDVEGLALVLVALFLLAEWDLGLVPCPEFGLIYA